MIMLNDASYLLLLIIYRPYKLRSRNICNILNVCFAITVDAIFLYISVQQEDLALDVSNRIGIVLVVLLGGCILVNLIEMIMMQFKTIKEQIKQRCKAKKSKFKRFIANVP